MDAAVLPDGRWLLYQRELREAITLSAPAGILWELCDGQTPVSDLLQQLQELYPDTPANQLESETAHILQQFLEQGLVYPSTA
jgi:hypothetical protein